MPDVELFSSLPGTDPCLAPRLLVAIDENRDRFKDAAEIQKYAGITPVTEKSGKKILGALALAVHPTFLRQSFVEWSAQSVPKLFWAGLYTINNAQKETQIRMC
ncbi:MAG: hypothetical protein ACJAZQ_001747 [Cognaticolwellia sp.]|jgi:hypothetical protein